MSNSSKIFHQVPVDVQNRSGYDASFEHVLTQKVGTLVPLACIECVPNQNISLGFFGQVALPPMATDFYGRVDYCVEAFWVPGRLLFGAFEDVFLHNTGENVPGQLVSTYYMPGFTFGYDKTICGAGTLLDYLGFKISQDSASGASTSVTVQNILPLVAYHLVWQEFYRSSRLTNPVFSKRSTQAIAPTSSGFVGTLPSVSIAGTNPSTQIIVSGLGAQFADGTYLYDLRQRCYGKDKFTNATYEPQQGTPTSLQFPVSGGTGSFTIGSWLTAYGMDQWKRKMNISGRYGDQQFADWGVYPESYFCDRPVYLGSSRFGIYNKSVYQASNDQLNYIQGIRNPFNNSVGAKYGSPVGVSDGSLVDSFSTTERGYLFVMGSVVPHAYYSTGVDPKFRRYRVTDFANPAWQVMGDEAILTSELSDDAATAANPSTFGYTQRFSSYKWNTDLVSGLLRDGESLSSFALKRSFGSTPQLSTSFVEIPTNALDEVAASADTLPSSFGAWSDIFFKLHTSMPLSAYTIPTLGQKKDTHTVMVESGGVRL